MDQSLFVSDAVHERDVTLPDGTVHKLHFKEIPAVEFRKFYNAEQSKDEDVQAASMSRLIAASLCEPDGKPAITVAQAKKLRTAAMNAIASVVMEVNGFGAKNV
jgi:hypothetical protein